MSYQDIRKVLLRLQSDDDFYQQLLQNPEDALAQYSLTSEEQEDLRRRDRALYKYLLPATPAEDRADFVITITGQHDWLNVSKMRPVEELPPDVFEQSSQLAERALGSQRGERVEILISLLKVLDGRSN